MHIFLICPLSDLSIIIIKYKSSFFIRPLSIYCIICLSINPVLKRFPNTIFPSFLSIRLNQIIHIFFFFLIIYRSIYCMMVVWLWRHSTTKSKTHSQFRIRYRIVLTDLWWSYSDDFVVFMPCRPNKNNNNKKTTQF